MKFPLLRILILLSMVLSYCVVCYGQEKSRSASARKFDEYKLTLGNAIEESKRLARFARQLKREPSTRAYVIAYGPRILDYYGSSYWDIAENRILTTKAELTHHYGLKESRFIGIDGGIREEATVEFWVLPVGATPPKPRPEFLSTDVVKCYPLSVQGAIYQLRRDLPIEFSVAFGLGSPNKSVSFRWAVSSGKIVRGQGTDSIKVDVSDATQKNVTATVEVEGLPVDCNEKGSATTAAGVLPYKLFEFEEKYPEALEGRLDELGSILNKESSLNAFIIVYGGRLGTRGYAAWRAGVATNYLISLRGVLPERFSISQGGYRENSMFEIWLMHQGTQSPPATPTVDEKYVRFTGQNRYNWRRR